VAVLIPAFDEAANVAPVVTAALAADLGPVLVIDDGSRDATARAARDAGAEVVRLERNRGKGAALLAGAKAVVEEVVVLLDADLVGLTAEHVRALAEPVMAGRVDMTRGAFRGGRWRTTAAQRITPQLNGQRALRRVSLLRVPGLAESRYGVEIAITRHAERRDWRCLDVPLEGVTQVMKEEKRGLLRGLAIRLRMYAEIVAALLRRGRAE
jgi:glycosyltransferase involved in cell wall biosynthesis